ncbi:MAG: 16S rRNA processing protein RimM [Chloroflexi bacterium]|nr:16S rRNA processing protein RimM [Chloroflexota bacterium]
MTSSSRPASGVPRKRTQRQPARQAAAQPIPQPQEGYIAVGWVGTPRGVQGELKVVALTDFPQRFAPGVTLWAGGVRYTVRRARSHRGTLLVKFEGIETRGQAETLRDLLLEVPEEELAPLEENQYFRFQVLGMEVVDQGGQPLGVIEEVLDTGADDVYIVRSAESELLIPAIDAVVKEMDVAGRRMVVELPEGLERRPVKKPKDS